jgi:hypothetical protein
MHVQIFSKFFRYFAAAVLGSVPAAHAVENPIFGYTHLLPSPFTLPAGKFMVGSTVGLGVTDFIQVETNLIADAYQVFNGRVRASLLDFPGFAGGVSLGYHNANPSLTLSSWMPGAVVGIEVLPDVALFLGGNLFYANVDPSSNAGIQSSGFLQGSQIESDISWAYNPHKQKLGNVLSAGLTYNTTFDFYGVGFSHHWRGFQLGIHYYLNATNLKVLPIASVGAVVEF